MKYTLSNAYILNWFFIDLKFKATFHSLSLKSISSLNKNISLKYGLIVERNFNW